MGSYASKLFARYGDEVVDSKPKSPCKEEIAPSTPVDTRKTLSIDPRSATAGIPRTPIEVNYTPHAGRRLVSAIPSHLQKKPYLETDLDNIGYLAPKKMTPFKNVEVDPLSPPVLHEQVEESEKPTIVVANQSPLNSDAYQSRDTPTAELRYKILGIDPRSPAADFDRTPILSLKSMLRLKARSHENLARRDSAFELGLSDQQRLSYCETVTMNNIPEVLALPDIASHLNKANDFNITTENSDQFDSCSSSSSSSSGSSSGLSIEVVFDSREEITVIPNPNIKSAKDAFASNITNSYSSSIEQIDDSQEIYYPANNISRVLSIATKTTDKQQPASAVEKKITVWRDSISSEFDQTPNPHVPEESTSALVQNDLTAIPKEEVMIEFDDNEIINTLKIKPTNKGEDNNDTKMKKEEFTERKNKNCDGKVFFHDKVFTPDEKKVPKVRTPLGNRSNNHGKVNGMPMKSPQQLLRGKAMSAKLHQENTPPRAMKSKLNGTQWDPDSTVLI